MRLWITKKNLMKNQQNEIQKYYKINKKKSRKTQNNGWLKIKLLSRLNEEKNQEYLQMEIT